MPQIFHVLRCYECLTFQIHQRKKTLKWECKMCGEKQSIKRNYGIGSNKVCRLHVQKLNLLQSQKHPESDIFTVDTSDDSDDNENISQNISPTAPAKASKWSKYIDKHDTQQEPGFSNTSDKYGKVKTINVFVPPHNVEAYPSIGSNMSKYTNLGQTSNETYREPTSLLNEQNVQKNRCTTNKESTSSSSKWASFVDDKGSSSSLLDSNLSGNASNVKSDVEESSMELDENLQSRIVKSNDTNLKLESSNSNVRYGHRSMFYMTTDEELEEILNY